MIKEKIFCGLDIGSRHIKAGLIKASTPDTRDLLGICESPTIGFKESSVKDLSELSECIHTTVSTLSRKTGIKLHDIQLGIGGDLIEMRHSSTAIPLVDRGNKVIALNDVKNINHQARLLGIGMEEEMLHEFPQCYKVDDVNTALNPVGLYGRKLEVDILMLVANVTRVNNIVKAVSQAGYEVDNLFFNSFACAVSCLTKQVKDDGCALVDIGASNTNVLIFRDGFLRHFERINWGGENVTRSIAKHLHLSADLAEEIKKSYAVASPAEDSYDEEILVKRDSGYMSLKKVLICKATEPEVQSIITSIENVIKQSDFYDQLNAGIVMIGGGALLPGLIERVEESTNLPVGIGKILIKSKGMKNAAVYAGAIGLGEEALNRASGLTFPLNGHAGLIKNTLGRIRELYQEYF